jgi:hypothetical protein
LHPGEAEEGRDSEDMTTHEIDRSREGATMTTPLCRRCRFHPVSPRIGGYCSWDCHDADDEEEVDEEDGEHAA